LRIAPRSALVFLGCFWSSWAVALIALIELREPFQVRFWCSLCQCADSSHRVARTFPGPLRCSLCRCARGDWHILRPNRPQARQLAATPAEPGAAFVSPLWYGNENAVRRESSNVRGLANTQPRAAGVSPPWFGEPSAMPRKPRNVRRPCDAGTRAAGVSPPWVLGKRTCRNTSAKSRGDCRRCTHERRWSRSREPTGGLRPPLLCPAVNVCRRKNDFCDAGTHMHKSGGREPAVVR
jgi:hypothetical protein